MENSSFGSGMHLEACVSLHVKKSFFTFFIILKKYVFTADPEPNIQVKVIFCNCIVVYKLGGKLKFLKDAIFFNDSTLSKPIVFFTFLPGQRS